MPGESVHPIVAERAQAPQPRDRPMAFPRFRSLPPPAVALGYLVAYVGLDWISFIHPLGPFGITPWNPPTGLSFVFALLFGRRYLPLLFVAPFLADYLVRAPYASFPLALSTATIIGAGYSVAALALLHPARRFDVSLSAMRDLFLLLGVAIVSAAGVAAGCITVYAVAGFVDWSQFGMAMVRYWVGDVIGIAVPTPFLLITLTRGRPFRLGWESALQFLTIGIALMAVFLLGQSRQLQLFYILFLPIVWIAVRAGLEGVTIGLVLTQLGLIAAMQTRPPAGDDMTAFQAMMLILALTGLSAGVLVTERRRAEMQLRLQQEAQAQLSRLGSMGELASALAHEINQPLMAAGTYARLVAETTTSANVPAKIADHARQAAAQIERASEVVRRLRNLIRLGRSERAPVAASRIIGDTLELLRPEIERGPITIEQRITGGLRPLMVDMLQAEQVLLNVVRNSIEAIREIGRGRGVIIIEAFPAGSGYVEIKVSDNGVGFPDALLSEALEPFRSTKPHGLGVGLSLCRSIIESHGGRLIIGNSDLGAVVRITFPTAEAA